MRRGIALLAMGVLVGGGVGCGGGGKENAPATRRVAVTLSPDTSEIPPGGSQSFVATVTNSDNRAVTWSVVEGDGGSITTDGVYTAPSTRGTYHVQAGSQADPARFATATVTVREGVFVTPRTAQLGVGQSLTFSSLVTNQPSQVVVWSVQEAGGGSITPDGVYTAPAQRGTYHVVATSDLDPTLSATVTVVVQSSSATGSIE